MSFEQIGNCWLADTVGRRPVAQVVLELAPVDLREHPGRIATTVDYVGRFFAPDIDGADELAAGLTVALEALLKNVAAFATDKRYTAELSVSHLGHRIRVETNNVCGIDDTRVLGERVRRLTKEDADDLHRAEQRWADAAIERRPHLGLITLKRDVTEYLGVAVEDGPRDELRRVTVRVDLSKRFKL